MKEIPDTELMAEKLGMIVLCENCGKRLSRIYVARIPMWVHEDTKDNWCDMVKITGNGKITGIWHRALPRNGPLADAYEIEPQ